MAKRLFKNDENHYNAEGKKLIAEVNAALKPIIQKAMKKGISKVELEYVLANQAKHLCVLGRLGLLDNSCDQTIAKKL